MREAALTIAALGDDFAPSVAARLSRALAALALNLRRRLTARRDLRRLRGLEPRLLADLGLDRSDLAGLDRDVSALEATRVLAARVASRRRAEERWARHRAGA